MKKLKIFFSYYFNYLTKKIKIYRDFTKLRKEFTRYDKIILLYGNDIGGIYLGLDVYFNDYSRKKVILTTDLRDFVSPLLANIIGRDLNVIFSSKLFTLLHFAKHLKNKINFDIYLPNSNKQSSFIKKSPSIKKKKFKNFLIKNDWSIVKKKLNLNSNKIIFFNNRDQVFKNDNLHNSFRNSGFKNLIYSLKYLKKQKYEVVRIGHYKYKKTSLYKQYRPKKNVERNLIENHIANKCKFAVCGVSGIMNMPIFFDKPLLLHNFIGFNKPPPIKIGIIIPKILTFQDGTILKIKDLFETSIFQMEYDAKEDKLFPFSYVNVGSFQSDKMYRKTKISHIENTPVEIFNGILEMENYFIKNKKVCKSHLKLDKKFKSFFPENHWIRASKVLISHFWLKNNIKYFNE